MTENKPFQLVRIVGDHSELFTPKDDAELDALFDNVANDYLSLSQEYTTLSFNAFAESDETMLKIKAVLDEYKAMRDLLRML